MASTYENDLRLEEMATGENSGSWGTKTNTNLELIADAFSYGTETIADADTTITIADGAADAARSLALKINSSADLTTTRTITLAPNTTSKVWIIENNTSGGQTLTISAGSGSNITLANGTTKIIATDGIGAGSNVVELTQDLAIADMSVDGILSLADGSNSAPSLTNTGDTNTGLYFPAADEVGITTGGTQRVKVDSTGIDVTGGFTATTSGTVPTLYGGSGASQTFTLQSTSGNSNHSKILVGNTVGADNGGISFYSAGSSVATERMRISGTNGNITFYDTDGTTASFVYDANAGTTFNDAGADRDFQVKSDTKSHAFFVDGDGSNNRLKLGMGTGTITNPYSQDNFTDVNIDGIWGAVISFKLNGTEYGWIGQRNSGNGDMIVGASSGQSLFLASNGNTSRIELTDAGNVVVNPTGADNDFQVKSANYNHMLFVDAGEDTVTIGGSDVGTHAGMFNVAGNLGVITGSGNPTITIKTGGTGNNPGINYRAGDNIIFDNTLIASAATDYWRVGHGSSGSVTSEVLAVTIDSRVGINDTTPSYTVDVRQLSDSADDGVNVQPNNQTQNMRYSFLGTTSTYFTEFMVDSTDSGTAGYRYFKFYEGTRDNNGELLYLGYDGTVFNTVGADRDFRVASNNSDYMIYLDGLQNSVGIKTNATDAALNVNSQSNVIDGIRIVGSGGNNFITGYGNQGQISFSIYENGADDPGNFKLYRNGIQSVFITADENTTTVFNDQGESNDFRVASAGNSHALFVDASHSAAVGVGTGSPESAVSGDAIIGISSYGIILQQQETSVASGSSVDLTVNSGGGGYQGMLIIANTVTANAAARTQAMYFVAGRGTDGVFNLISSDDGTTGGAGYSLTFANNGLIRMTNNAGSASNIVMSFFGSKSL